MKYFVRTTLERKLDNSYSQIGYKLLIDKEHRPVESFINQIKELSKLNEDVVILEDDLVLCRGFKNKIESIINSHKENIVNFFSNPLDYYPSFIGKPFLWHQCVYYPKEAVKYMSNNLEKLYNNCKTKHYDLLAMFTLKYNFDCYFPRPCLVQHLDFNTLIQEKTANRNTPYFIDYLEDLNIPYEQAKEHKLELIEYMKKHLAQVRKEMNIDG